MEMEQDGTHSNVITYEEQAKVHLNPIKKIPNLSISKMQDEKSAKKRLHNTFSMGNIELPKKLSELKFGEKPS